MNQLVRRGFLWILIFFHVVDVSERVLECGKCLPGSSYLTCPNYDEKHFSLERVKVSNEYSLEIECAPNKTFVNFTLLEGCSFPSVTGVTFKFCPFNDEFSSNLKTIGLFHERIKYLKIYHPNSQVTELLPIHLQQLPNLSYLMLEFVGLHNISEDTFKHIPALEAFYLSGNDLQTLEKDTFKPLTNLTILSLSNDQLSDIPEGLFDGLVKLKVLSLWKNHIKYLPPNIFDDLVMLENLTLLSNSLSVIDGNLFSSTPNLLNVNFRINNLTTLPERLFQNCTKLVTVKFGRNNIETVPVNLFEGATSLIHVDFSENKLQTLPENLFSGLQSLKHLDCKKNRISHLESALLFENAQLDYIDFSSNEMETLPAELFINASKVTSIDFSRNKIKSVPDYSFANCESLEALILSHNNFTSLYHSTLPKLDYSVLKKIDLSNNQLTGNGMFKDSVFAFNAQLYLEEIDLSFNNFTSFPSLELYNYQRMELLNFEGNYLSGILLTDFLDLPNGCKVNLKNNRLETALLNYNVYKSRLVEVLLEGNNFTCDCRLYELINQVQDTRVDFLPPYRAIGSSEQEPTAGVVRVVDREKLLCRRPGFLANQRLVDVDLALLTCKMLANECSAECPCIFRRVDNMVIVDCSNRNMTSIPDIRYFKLNYTLDLSGNRISSLFELSNQSVASFVNISLMNNQLTAEFFSSETKLPAGLKFLDLRRNNLSHLPDEFLSQLNQTETEIDISQNPWMCDCSIRSLHNFIQAHFKRVKQIRNVLCEGSSNPRQLVDLTEEDICPLLQQPLVLSAIGVVTVVLVALAVVASVSYYKYKIPLKVWLYKNRLCLCLIIEDELDQDKEYDAFISFSHKDEEFVNKILVPGLENGDPKYKLCLHYRDWMVGEYIPNQIVNTVQNSRRTLVVLSSNFIESVWGQMEFRAAHKQAMEDKTNRVIIVVYGEMPPTESLDKDLQYYVSLHTYLRWDHPRFWDNLRYAMPHPRGLLSKRHNVHDNKTQFELTNGIEIRNGHLGHNGVSNGPIVV